MRSNWFFWMYNVLIVSLAQPFPLPLANSLSLSLIRLWSKSWFCADAHFHNRCDFVSLNCDDGEKWVKAIVCNDLYFQFFLTSFFPLSQKIKKKLTATTLSAERESDSINEIHCIFVVVMIVAFFLIIVSSSSFSTSQFPNNINNEWKKNRVLTGIGRRKCVRKHCIHTKSHIWKIKNKFEDFGH